MSSEQINLSLTLAFADSEKIFTIEGIPEDGVPDIKDNILAVNANQNGAYDALYATFLSNAGASFVGITAGRIVSIQEEVIYNG